MSNIDIRNELLLNILINKSFNKYFEEKLCLNK